MTFGVFSLVQLNAQDTPTDYLSAEFHKERREKVRGMMSPNSVLVFFANAERNRANDVDYIYHQDPDFYYLTGYREPNAVLLIFSEQQQNPDGASFNEIIYVQKRDARAEQWDGKRLGVEGTREKLGFDMAFNGDEFSAIPVDFSSFDMVSFFDFENDYRDKRGEADLFDLIKIFKEKANYPSDYDAKKQELYSMITSTPIENSANVAQILGRYLNSYTNLQEDELLTEFANSEDEAVRKEIREKVLVVQKTNNLDSSMISEIMNTLRETKTQEELVLLKKAIEISAVGQIEVMKAMRPNMSEIRNTGRSRIRL